MISNYTELQNAVTRWTNRTDLAAHIPDFVMLAEERIWAMLRAKALRLSFSVSYAAAAESVALPADCITVLSVRDVATGRSGDVDFINEDQYAQAQNAFFKPDKTQVIVTGRELVFAIPPSTPGALEGRYLAREPALSVSNATNQVLTWYPSVYLNATLLEAFDYLQDTEKVMRYAEKLKASIAQANAQNAHSSKQALVAPRVTVV
ncbi:MAG: phage adaptor protein [Burkholderiaceae bacterium]